MTLGELYREAWRPSKSHSTRGIATTENYAKEKMYQMLHIVVAITTCVAARSLEIHLETSILEVISCGIGAFIIHRATQPLFATVPSKLRNVRASRSSLQSLLSHPTCGLAQISRWDLGSGWVRSNIWSSRRSRRPKVALKSSENGPWKLKVIEIPSESA